MTDKSVERRINREERWVSPLYLVAKALVKAAAGVAVIRTQTPWIRGGEFNRLVVRSAKKGMRIRRTNEP